MKELDEALIDRELTENFHLFSKDKQTFLKRLGIEPKRDFIKK